MKTLLDKVHKDPSKLDGSYQDSLIRVTKSGTKLTTLFFLGFMVIYWFGDYPVIAVWINLAAVFCSLNGYLLITKFNQHRIAAHLTTFAIYLSSAGVMAVSGGIHSSSVIWLIFVPVASFSMAGLRAGLRWGMASLATLLGFYILENVGILNITYFVTTTKDLFIDISGAIIATSIAIWYSDRIKSTSLKQLEEAQAQLNFLASIDPLTNTFNRRYFLEQSERNIQRICTSQGYASFLLFDIDHFKIINDTHGHIIGDQILRGIAKACTLNLRPDDILGRFGGEEFVILLPDTSVGNARNIAERLRILIEQTPMETEIGSIYVTISIGVAIMDEADALSIEQLLNRADMAMYRAKQAGRNRVMIWEEAELERNLS